MRSTPGWSDTEREKRKREPDGGSTEWASHYLNSLQILNAKGIYIYCFENRDMMAINQLEERKAEVSVTVHAMGQVK